LKRRPLASSDGITGGVTPAALPPLSLAYHGVSIVRANSPGAGLFVRPRDLSRQIQALRRWGYRLVTFSEQAKLAQASRAEGTASLTFDDGFADNYSTLLPLLKRFGAPATIFVVSGWLGGLHPDVEDMPILSADQLRLLRAGGCEIGGHTVTHPDLTAIGVERVTYELAECRRVLEGILDTAITSMAYPYDRADDETQEACAAAGYLFACRGPEGSWERPLGLPRQHMNYGGGMLGLRLKRRGRYEALMQHLPARAARRVIRRGRQTLRSVSRDHF
jgi:peptidoglycan/xylan/chitin deacetylase (PgdA/CDA1 family)